MWPIRSNFQGTVMCCPNVPSNYNYMHVAQDCKCYCYCPFKDCIHTSSDNNRES